MDPHTEPQKVIGPPGAYINSLRPHRTSGSVAVDPGTIHGTGRLCRSTGGDFKSCLYIGSMYTQTLHGTAIYAHQLGWC